MFARSNVPPETSEELIAGLNASIVRLRSMLVNSVQIAGPHSGPWYRNLIQIYIQAHLRRLLSFLDAGHEELHKDRPLVTHMCARAIYETVACFRDFVVQVLPLIDAEDIDNLDNFLRTRIFATRVPSLLANDSSVSATNILSQIDKLGKDQPRAREAYDHLSDIVHPNALGSVIYFSELSSDGLMTFPSVTSAKSGARDAFFGAACLALFFIESLEQLEPRLQDLAADIQA
jgi:hypothetical protein